MRINNLVEFGLKCFNLSSQCLHLLSLRGNRLGLLSNQVLDILNLLGNGVGGNAVLGSRGRRNGSLK